MIQAFLLFLSNYDAFSANSITGFKMASIGKEPNFAWTAKHQLSFLEPYCERRFAFSRNNISFSI
jgi:hypothetical protein